MKRIEILAAVLLAFSTGSVDGAGLSVAQWEYAERVIETEFGGDFDRLAGYLKAEQSACALVCRVSEAREPRRHISTRTIRRAATSARRVSEKG